MVTLSANHPWVHRRQGQGRKYKTTTPKPFNPVRAGFAHQLIRRELPHPGLWGWFYLLNSGFGVPEDYEFISTCNYEKSGDDHKPIKPIKNESFRKVVPGRRATPAKASETVVMK